MKEQTLSIVKPDGVKANLVGEVIKRFETAGLQVRALRMVRLSKDAAQRFYAVHRERPFFDSLTAFMSSGPAVVMVLEGEGAIAKVRELMGATNPKDAKPGTIRAEYASGIEQNVVHGSDAPETARNEINYFFGGIDRGEVCGA